MASQIPEITESNQTDNSGDLEHIRADLCEILRILTAWDQLLTEFAPLLAQYRTTPLATMITRRSRRAANGRE